MKTTKSFWVFSYAALFKIVYGEVMMLSNLSSQEGHQDSLLFCFFSQIYFRIFLICLFYVQLKMFYQLSGCSVLISGYVHASGEKNRPLRLNECVDHLLTILHLKSYTLLNVFIETNLAMMGWSVINRQFFCCLLLFFKFRNSLENT